jgi:hypothetical protein
VGFIGHIPGPELYLLAVGTVVGALSAGAQPLAVGGQTYYYENNNYYQPCYQGSDSGYCVVQNPNE